MSVYSAGGQTYKLLPFSSPDGEGMTVIVWGLVAAFLFWPLSQPSIAGEIPLIDAHSQLPDAKTADRVIRLMDEAGITHMILSFRGDGKARDVIALAQANPGRVTPAIKIKGNNWPKGGKKFINQVKNQLNTGAFGAIGEALIYHAEKGNKAPEWTVLPTDQQFRHVLDVARKFDWPVITHIEFRAAPDRDRFMALLETLLADNRDLAFPLIHMAQLGTEDVERLIAKHPNVYFMTSHSNPITIVNSNQPWTNMFSGDELNSEWRKLLVAHSDRFILNFDNVWPEDWGSQYLQQVTLWRRALARLPSDAAHKIAHENAERLWKLTLVDGNR